jgi:Protein of unknown function (DUF4236)
MLTGLACKFFLHCSKVTEANYLITRTLKMGTFLAPTYGKFSTCQVSTVTGFFWRRGCLGLAKDMHESREFSKSYIMVRLNFSKRGIGVSTGLEGTRNGTNPRGKKYLHFGRGGFYYQESLPGGLVRVGITWRMILLLMLATTLLCAFFTS